MDTQKVRITWNGMGGELYYVTVEVSHNNDTALTTALMVLIKGQIVSPGDSFTVQAVD